MHQVGFIYKIIQGCTVSKTWNSVIICSNNYHFVQRSCFPVPTAQQLYPMGTFHLLFSMMNTSRPPEVNRYKCPFQLPCYQPWFWQTSRHTPVLCFPLLGDTITWPLWLGWCKLHCMCAIWNEFCAVVCMFMLLS